MEGIIMKWVFIVFTLLATHIALGQGIRFEKDLSWQQLKSKAKAENKYIFLDVMASWCGPCKVMDREVFTNAAVGEFFNDKFVSVKVQTDQTAEDTEVVKRWYKDAQQIAQVYSVTVLPSFVFLTPDGALASKVNGMRSAAELIDDTKKAMEPANQYSVLLNQYMGGKRDTAHVNRLLSPMRDMGRTVMAGKLKGTDFLAKNGSGKPVKPTAGLAGNWMINYPLCDFGKQSIKSASKEMGISLNDAVLSVTRSVTGGQVEDLLPLSGKVVSVPVKADGRNKNMMLFNAGGFDLAQFTEMTYPDSKTEVEYTVTDKWKLTDNGKRLVVDRLYHMNGGQVTLKLVYDRK